MAIDIIGSYRKWSLLTAPPIILGGIVGTVIICDFLFRKTVLDEAVTKCTSCGTDFSAFVRKHHCRNCGDIFCDKCTHGRIALTTDENAPQVRVCDRCMAEVTHRSSNTKEVDSRSAALKSHEDLAKKLQDIDVCYAFVEFKDIAGVQNAIKIFRALDFIFYGLEIKKHGKQADILVQLDALGLKIIQVTAYGNCFFRALADQLEGNEDEHMKYRIMVVDFIRDGTWAGHMEIQAASLVTHSNICIHQKMSPRWYIQNFDNREAQMIHLSYHDEEHYNSVRLKEDTCSGAARPVTIKADVDISTKSHQTKVSVTKSKGKADKNIIQAGSVKMVMVGSGCENYQKAEQVLLLMPQFLITEQGSEESLVENDNFSFSAGISHGENQNDNPVPHKAEVDDNTEKRGQSCDNIERTRDNNILQQFEKRIIPSRNKACPCGSKKKYKSCCGSVAGRSSAKFAINQTVDYGEGRKNKKQGKKSGANNVANSHVSEGEPPDVGALCI